MSTDAKPCVLIAEDEMMVAMMLEDSMQHAGYRVLMAGRVAKGLALIASESVDVAILDINLASEFSFPLADELRRCDIPFLFTSGYGREGLTEDHRDAVMLQKPYDMITLHATLAALLATDNSRNT